MAHAAKDFGRTRAIADFTFEAPKGITCLVGANGSGKTTALHLVLGFFPPTEGRVEVLGRDPWSDYAAVRRRVSGAIERQELPADMACGRLLEHVARIRGLHDPSATAIEGLEAVGLRRSQEARIRTLSAGMYQRLLIAFAILGSPEVVLLDEPNANLDPQGRQRLADILDSLRREEGMSFLVATHLLDELRRTSEWVVVAEVGKVVRQGPPRDVLMSSAGAKLAPGE